MSKEEDQFATSVAQYPRRVVKLKGSQWLDNRLRKPTKEDVEKMANTLRREKLQNPPIFGEYEDGRLILIAGATRVLALLRINPEAECECTIVPHTENWRKIELSENEARSELTPAQRVVSVWMRYQVNKSLTAEDNDDAGQQPKKKPGRKADPALKMTIAELGRWRQAVERDIKRADAMLARLSHFANEKQEDFRAANADTLENIYSWVLDYEKAEDERRQEEEAERRQQEEAERHQQEEAERHQQSAPSTQEPEQQPYETTSEDVPNEETSTEEHRPGTKIVTFPRANNTIERPHEQLRQDFDGAVKRTQSNFLEWALGQLDREEARRICTEFLAALDAQPTTDADQIQEGVQ